MQRPAVGGTRSTSATTKLSSARSSIAVGSSILRPTTTMTMTTQPFRFTAPYDWCARFGGEAKKKRVRMHVRKKSHGGPGEKTPAVGGEAAGSSQISSPGPAVGGSPGSVHKKSAPAVGYSSYRDSDYERPAVGGAAAPEVSTPAVRGEAPCVSDSNSESDYDAHRRQRAKKKKSG